mmetsp:Transcript_6902/g.21568  ORF Transcript_6902/g.21568 Transcript_6902/m.21568 type:complete len:263 (+) Transcript_6902:1925-2713(+)
MQDAFAALMLEEFAAAFRRERLPLLLRPYAVVATCADGGLLETLVDARSFDAIARHASLARLPPQGAAGGGGAAGPIAEVFRRMFGGSAERLAQARERFVQSMAAYSVFCFVLRIKDRHDGNILLCRDGSVAHVDFGIMLNVRYAKDVLEADLKLSKDMVDIMGDQFDMFRSLCEQSLLAIRKHSRHLLMVIEMFKMAGAGGAGLPCLEGDAIAQVQNRLQLHMSDAEAAREIGRVVDKCKDAAITKILDFVHSYAINNVAT